MTTRVKLALSTVLAVGVVLASAPARADEEGPRPRRTFYVESKQKDEACTAAVAPLASAITLACDASATSCRASATPGGADRKVILDCTDPETWNLESFDASGTSEWTVALTGPTDERLRAGAMTALRFEMSKDPPPTLTPSVPVVESGPPTAEQIERQNVNGRTDVAKGLVYGGFAIATAATAVGVILAIDYSRRKDDLKGTEETGNVCSDGPCSRGLSDDVGAARRTGTYANVAFAVAIVGAASGIVGLVMWPRAPKKTVGVAAAVTPVVGLGSLGLRSDF